MPSTEQHNEQAAPTPDISPARSREHGENPARFLDVDIRPDHGDGTSGELLFARIRGLETVALVRYWVAIERRLAAMADREPRDRVIRALAQRERDLEAHGDGLAQAGLTAAERRDDGRDSDSVAQLLDESGETVSWRRQRGAVVEASDG